MKLEYEYISSIRTALINKEIIKVYYLFSDIKGMWNKGFCHTVNQAIVFLTKEEEYIQIGFDDSLTNAAEYFDYYGIGIISNQEDKLLEANIIDVTNDVTISKFIKSKISSIQIYWHPIPSKIGKLPVTLQVSFANEEVLYISVAEQILKDIFEFLSKNLIIVFSSKKANDFRLVNSKFKKTLIC